MAEHTGLVFVDTDDLIQQRSEKSIAQIVRDHGWETFRHLEHQTLASVCAQSGQSVATGGGIVLRKDNRELLRSTGYVFYLLADVRVLQKRLADEDDESWRPSLTGLDTDQEIAAILAEREPLYFRALHYLLSADKPVHELVQDVLERLGIAGI
jgi:shikimate kinase